MMVIRSRFENFGKPNKKYNTCNCRSYHIRHWFCQENREYFVV